MKKIKVQCDPEKNIHIFDDEQFVCQCWGTDIKGARYPIPIKAQEGIKFD